MNTNGKKNVIMEKRERIKQIIRTIHDLEEEKKKLLKEIEGINELELKGVPFFSEKTRGLYAVSRNNKKCAALYHEYEKKIYHKTPIKYADGRYFGRKSTFKYIQAREEELISKGYKYMGTDTDV